MHLREMNHSRRFWRQVEQVCPDFQKAESWLKHTRAFSRRGEVQPSRAVRACPKVDLFIAHLIAHLIECSGFRAFSIKWRIKVGDKVGQDG